MGAFIEKQAFFPPTPPNPINFKNNLVQLKTKSNHCIPALHFQVDQWNPHGKFSKYTLLFSHGNAEDLGIDENWLDEMAKRIEINIFAYDYSGYGTSFSDSGVPLSPSERSCYEDVEAAYDYLVNKKGIPANTIIAFGKSLGTGPTCELASKHEVRAVILQSPLLSAIQVVKTTSFVLPFDIFANQNKIKHIQKPIFIMHGTEDEVIDVYHGKTLHQMIEKTPYAANPWWVTGCGHNDIEMDSDRYVSMISNFLSGIDKQNELCESKKEMQSNSWFSFSSK